MITQETVAYKEVCRDVADVICRGDDGDECVEIPRVKCFQMPFAKDERAEVPHCHVRQR